MITFPLSSRSPLFWILLSLISIGGTIFAYKFFPKAFAIVQANITMNRKEALEAAKERADGEKIGPTEYNQAAVFNTDSETKNFIELEGGGTAQLEEILKDEWYTPYFWQVRHFKQYDPHEASFYYMPNGKPYGFQEKLSQYEKGPALSEQQAKQIAEQSARQNWHISFDKYQLAETAKNTALSGRIDHTFIYERTDKKVAEAPYRLKLAVGGDRLTELSYSIKVPDAFKRRYEDMRSANRLIAFIATFFMGLLYLGLGLIVGLIFLLHRHLIWWRPAFIAAFIISLLQIINGVNELPLDWIDYETALSKTSFLLKFATSLISQFIVYLIILTLIFAVAEGLTRAAFPRHLLLWRAFTKHTASSIQLIGRVIGGYLIIGFDLAFVIGVYTFARAYLGWWNPSETLIDPNILSTYMPWFTSIARSLMAGMMEESLFRAIPLAGAALIARRFGYRIPIMIFAFILQAVIFGAAHASYPAQPAYARLLELIIPSFVFGGIYLVYGLIPAMLSHVVFDVFWFALPLFLASGLTINKLLVIFISLLPIWVIIRSLLEQRKSHEAPTSAYNEAWINETKEEKTDYTETYHYHPLNASSIVKLSIAASFACVIWLFTGRFSQDITSLTGSRSQALDQALQLIEQKNIPVSQSPWQPLLSTHAKLEDEHRFVWQTNGKKKFHELLGNYLPSAQWNVRFAQFEGDLQKRAEEYELFLDRNNNLNRLKHELPESQAGASLSQEDARTLIHEHLKTLYKINPANLIELSAESIKQPNRIDWQFTFKDPSVHLTQGEARIKITLLGNLLGDYERLVFIPEEWERSYKEHETYESILSMLCRFILIGALIGLGFALARRWRYMHVSIRVFIGIACIIGIKAFTNSFNMWPLVKAHFVTNQPIFNQALTAIGWYALMIFVQALTLGAGASLATAIARKPHINLALSLRIFIAACCSIILVAARALMDKIIPQPVPFFADYSFVGSYFAWFSLAASLLTSFVTTTIVMILMARAVDYFTLHKRNQFFLTIISFIILYGAYNGLEIDGIALWLAQSVSVGIMFTILYQRFIRSHYELWPWITAISGSLFAIQQIIINPYPGAFLGNLTAIVLITSIAWWWSNELSS